MPSQPQKHPGIATLAMSKLGVLCKILEVNLEIHFSPVYLIIKKN